MERCHNKRLKLYLIFYFSSFTRSLTSPIIALGIGRSNMVLRPGSEFITKGIIFTHMATVAIPPGISGFI